jgi:hypothetical protein
MTPFDPVQMVLPTADPLQKRHSLQNFANTALQAAARLWFLVAVIGQALFASYIASFYGRTAARGDMQAWSKFITRGYVSHDPIGNFTVVTHLFMAVVVTVGGPLQLIPQLRDRVRSFHRWNGRVYTLAAFATSVAGLYMVWIRGSVGDVSQHVGISVNAVLITICAAMALRRAVARDFKTHRRWALRLFLVVSGVWFFRVGLFLSFLLFKGPFGFDPTTFQGPFLTFMSFAEYLLPLGVLELYLRAQDRAGAPGRFAVAAGLFVLTVAMGAGIFAVTMALWLPTLRVL